MFVIDVDALLKKIPRPERSGVTGAAMAVGCLLAIVTQTYPLEELCQLLPWGCPAQIETADSVVNRRQIHWLMAGPSSGKSSGCYCHQRWEAEFPSGHKKTSDSMMLLSCDDQREYQALQDATVTSGFWWYFADAGGRKQIIKWRESWVCSKKPTPAAGEPSDQQATGAARKPK